MQSKTSFFNGTIFKKNMTYYWPIWLLFFIYLICQIPIRIFFNTASVVGVTAAEAVLQQKTDNYFIVLSSNLQPIVCFAGGVISAMSVFHYMYFSRSTQAYHSFPVRREELFLTSYVSGFVFYTVPLLLSFLFGACICTFRGITALEYLFLWFLLMEGMCFFFYNMTILVGMFTGQFFVVPLLTLLLNYLYVGCRSVVLTVMGMISYGLSDIYSERTVSFLSPLYFMMEKVNFLINWESSESRNYLVNGCAYVAVYAALGLLFGLIAFFMYRRRRLECVGDTMIINLVRPVFRWIFAGGISLLLTTVICGYMPKQMAERQFLLVLILTIAVGIPLFFIGEALLQRKAKVFSRARILECACYTALMAAFLACVEFNAFGLETRLPDETEIASAQVEMYYPLYFDKKQEIQQMLELHKQVIASKEEFEAYQADKMHRTTWVRFYYKMKDGTPFIRNYEIPVDDNCLADDTSVAAQIRRKSCDVDSYYRGNLCKNYKDARVEEVSLDVCDQEGDVVSIRIEHQDWEKLKDALDADIREGNILSRLGTEYDEEDDFNYWNTFSVTLYAGGGLLNPWQDSEYYLYSLEKEGYYSISFNRDCVHIVETLSNLGIINDTDKRLMTAGEYMRMLDERDVMGDYVLED